VAVNHTPARPLLRDTIAKITLRAQVGSIGSAPDAKIKFGSAIIKKTD
jgi:hypothetical protein